MNTTGNRRSTSRTPALAIAGMLLSACTSAAPAAPAGITPSPAPSSTMAPSQAAIVEEFDAGGAGWAMTKAGDALWIQVDPPVDAIVRIDIATGSTSAVVAGGWKAKSGNEGLWVVCFDCLYLIEAASGMYSLRFDLCGEFEVADGSVWIGIDDGLYRIDASTGMVGEAVGPGLSSVCEASKDLVVAFGSAWLACKEGKVVRIDLSSGEAATIPTAPGSHTFTVADGAVWVSNYKAGSVSRIDPESNEVTTIAGVGSGVGITSGGGFVWAATTDGIARIDPAAAAIVDEIHLGPGEYYELVWDDGIIWVSTRGNRVLKVDPSKG
jgi:hypothetical protein